MDVARIVKKFLEDNKFDGLFTEDCACSIKEFFPCGEIKLCCEPGYEIPCGDDCCDEYDFHIVKDKPKG